MVQIRLPRVEQLVGCELGAVDEAALQRLIDGKITEDADIDFKAAFYDRPGSPPNQWKHGRVKYASDTAAMANTRGGLIIIGVEEHDRTAVALTPQVLTDGDEQWLQQSRAEHISPLLEAVDVWRVKSSQAGRHYLLSAVAPSPQAPHAVHVGKDTRYPVRDGEHTVYLTESEISERYRSRFAGESQQVDRLRRITDDVFTPNAESREPWLVAGMVPNTTGAIPLNELTTGRMRNWVRRLRTDVAMPHSTLHMVSDAPTHARVALRRIIVEDAHPGPPWRPMETFKIDLHLDGAAAAGLLLSHGTSDRQDAVDFDHLIGDVDAILALLAGHAVENAGVVGDAVLSVGVRGPSLTARSAVLVHSRQGEIAGEVGTAPPTRLPVTVETTVALGELANDVAARMQATRRILAELVTAFGVASVPHITHAGGLVIDEFCAPLQPAIRQWWEAAHIPEGAPAGGE